MIRNIEKHRKTFLYLLFVTMQQPEQQRLDPRKKNTMIIIFKLLKFHRARGE